MAAVQRGDGGAGGLDRGLWIKEKYEMSKIKLPLIQAQTLAGKILATLSPGCQRVEIAGSIRREKAEIGDIEIVAIPRPALDLFGQPIGSALDTVLADLLHAGRLVRGDKNGENYKNFFVPSVEGLKLDLFITSPECWGVIFTIRTGSADFSRRLVTQSGKSGLLPNDLRVSGGRIWRGLDALETPEEADVFELIGGPGYWVEPKDRK